MKITFYSLLTVEAIYSLLMSNERLTLEQFNSLAIRDCIYISSLVHAKCIYIYIFQEYKLPVG